MESARQQEKLFYKCAMGYYTCHPSWSCHCQGDAGNKPSASAPPSTERAGGFQSKKGCLWGGCQNGFCCPADLWDFCTQTNSEQSQEDGVQSALIVNPRKEEDSVIIVLFWVGLCGLVSYLGEVVVATRQMLLISEFPEAVGGTSRDSQLGQEIWEHFTGPRQWAV